MKFIQNYRTELSIFLLVPIHALWWYRFADTIKNMKSCFIDVLLSWNIAILFSILFDWLKASNHVFLKTVLLAFPIYLLLIFNLLKIIIKAPITISKTPGEAFINFDVKSVPSIIQLMFPVNPKMVSIIPPIMQKMPLHKLKIIIIYSYFIAVSPKAVLAILGSISTVQLCKQRKVKIEIMSIYIALFILFWLWSTISFRNIQIPNLSI